VRLAHHAGRLPNKNKDGEARRAEVAMRGGAHQTLIETPRGYWVVKRIE
jgi:hypothetical protein